MLCVSFLVQKILVFFTEDSENTSCLCSDLVHGNTETSLGVCCAIVSAHYLLILLGVGCHEQSCRVEETTRCRGLWSQMFHIVKLHRNIFHEDNILCVLVSNSASTDACWAT
jgi:hypothetical protein